MGTQRRSKGMLGMRASAELLPAVKASGERVVSFLQRLVQVPSRTGNEEQIAALVARELRLLGIADTWIDGAGNIIGRLPGGGGRRVMLHAHLDTVDPGDSSRWTHPPYAGELADDAHDDDHARHGDPTHPVDFHPHRIRKGRCTQLPGSRSPVDGASKDPCHSES